MTIKIRIKAYLIAVRLGIFAISVILLLPLLLIIGMGPTLPLILREYVIKTIDQLHSIGYLNDEQVSELKSHRMF